MDEWGLALTVMSLVIVALGAAVGVAVIHGSEKEKVRALVERVQRIEVDLKDAERRLARGDTQFAIVTQAMKGIEEKLDAMMQMLTNAAAKRSRREDRDDDEDEPN